VGYAEGFLDGLRQAGDPSTDDVIDELARAEQVRAVSDVLRSLTYNDQPAPAELPSSIGRWLSEHGELPGWVDRDPLERGCAIVVEHGPQVCVALATASLVYCYAGYLGVKVLTFSRRLGQDADRRVGETAQFVLAVMAPGSLDPCGRGIRKIQKIRLLQAAIRHLVTGSRRSDVETDGVPICQEDLVGTLLSFSWIVVDALRKLGVRIDDQEAEDYHYRWRVIGEILGVQPAAIPADLTQARDLTRQIARRNHRRSDEGMLMTRAQSARGPVGSLTKMVGAGILNQRVVGMAGRPSANFSIPVPPELHRRWTASGAFQRIDPELIEIAQAQRA
jgi:ER-bound oxygenase mpaB/B'/Rubber oxygenase, catalytic domain